MFQFVTNGQIISHPPVAAKIRWSAVALGRNQRPLADLWCDSFTSKPPLIRWPMLTGSNHGLKEEERQDKQCVIHMHTCRVWVRWQWRQWKSPVGEGESGSMCQTVSATSRWHHQGTVADWFSEQLIGRLIDLSSHWPFFSGGGGCERLVVASGSAGCCGRLRLSTFFARFLLVPYWWWWCSQMWWCEPHLRGISGLTLTAGALTSQGGWEVAENTSTTGT